MHAWLNLAAKGPLVLLKTTQAEVLVLGNSVQIVGWLAPVTCTEIDVVQTKPL